MRKPKGCIHCGGPKPKGRGRQSCNTCRGKAGFWSRVTAGPGDCWIWTGRMVKGYGVYKPGKLPSNLAHRLSYRIMVAEIPDGLELDHLCRVPLCVNPYHLEPVTRIENMRRRVEAQTHCTDGHPRTGDNAYRRRGEGYGQGLRCRACQNETVRRYRARKAAAG